MSGRVIQAHVSSVQGNRMGDRSEMVRVSASYQSANIIGALTFDVPTSEARAFYVGQEIQIVVKWPDPA